MDTFFESYSFVALNLVNISLELLHARFDDIVVLVEPIPDQDVLHRLLSINVQKLC